MTAAAAPARTPPASLYSALAFFDRGWSPLWIPLGSKGPLEDNWQAKRPTREQIARDFATPGNVGVRLGDASGGLLDVDVDSPAALKLARYFLPPTGAIFGRKSKPRSHWVYTGGNPSKIQKFRDPTAGQEKKATIIELRGTGGQTIFPGSLHGESGELVCWDCDGAPASVPFAELLVVVARIAAAALFVEHYPPDGARHDAMLALAGLLLLAELTVSESELFIEAVATVAGDPGVANRVATVKTTAEKLERGEPVVGGPTLQGLLVHGARIVPKVGLWVRGMTEPFSRATRDRGDWPVPAPLGDELPPVPPFDLELLPSSFRPLVEDVSELMQTPPDYAAAAAIVALGGCVGRRALIRPKQEDSSWVVVPNLWGGTIAPPGMMKSPVLHAVTLPLAHIEEGWHAEFESACADFASEKELAELRYQAWREQFKSAIKKGEAAPVQPDRTRRAPTQKRLVLTDATFEKLHEILSENHAGVLVVRDELTGWLAEFERHGREGERAFFLQAWNGDCGFAVDRIGRGSIYVPHVCVSVFGNIQPSRLRWYLSDAVEGGLNDDGLFQRFQVLVWPDPPRHWRLVDRPPNIAAVQHAERIFRTLADLSADKPVRMRFDPGAQQLFFDWWPELECKVRGDYGLPPPLVAHLAKYRSLMPSLAGLFELADLAAANLRDEILINLDHARQGAALCEYLEAHARRVYSCIVSSEMQAARELARHIQVGDLPKIFTTRMVYLKGWGGLDTPERARTALELLEDLGWVRQEDPPQVPGRGRPAELWLVNPRAVPHAE